jgi:tRNA threonylcarbamoyladenosine biosynthesis protein TsaB
MKLLSIDTTAEICSIALLSGEQWFCFHQERPREHAKILLPEIQKLLNQAQIMATDLDYIVFGRGPGSFTGIRIAAGVAHGLALSANCSLLPISTLDSLAYSAIQSGATDIWSAIDARMSEIYFAEYRVDDEGLPILEGQERVLAPADIQSIPSTATIFIGSGWTTDYDMRPEIETAVKRQAVTQRLPDAKHSALLAIRSLQAGRINSVSPEQALPVYLRDKVTWDNKPKVGS